MPNSREAVKDSPGRSAYLLLVSRSSLVQANIAGRAGRKGLSVTDDLRSRPAVWSHGWPSILLGN
jgi:hypothetical protein